MNKNIALFIISGLSHSSHSAVYNVMDFGARNDGRNTYNPSDPECN